MKKHFNKIDSVYFFLFIPMLLYIGLYCFLGYYNHPQSDDYWVFMVNQGKGSFETVGHYYNNWMGNYSWVFCGSIIGKFKDLFLFVKWYPTFLVFCSLMSLLFFLSAFKNHISLRERFVYALLSQCVWLAVMSGLQENFYWFAGSNGYYNTCIVIIVQLGFMARLFYPGYASKRFAFTGLVISTIFAGGMSSVTVVSQIPFFFLLSIICWFYYDKKTGLQFLFITGIAFICLLVVYFSPGTIIRSSVDGTVTRSFSLGFSVAFDYGTKTFIAFLKQPFIYLVILFLPLYSKHIIPITDIVRLPFKPRLIYVFILEYMIAYGCNFVSGFSLGYFLPARAVGLTHWLMFVFWFLFFACYYRKESLSQKIEKCKLYKIKHLLLILCFIFNANFIFLIYDFSIASNYSSQLNAQYEYVKQQKAKGNLDVVLSAPTYHPKLLRFHLGLRIPFNAMLFARYWNIESVKEVPFYVREIVNKGDDPKDTNLSLHQWAELGAPTKQLELAKKYITKGHLNKDQFSFEKAFVLCRGAAQQGNKEAQSLLVRLYRNGFGCDQSYVKAFKWFIFSHVKLPYERIASFQDLAKVQLCESYEATLAEGIDFRKKGLPSFIAKVAGLSDYDKWGRWSDAKLSPSVSIVFKKNLPDKFILDIDGVAYGPNIGNDLTIKVGTQKYIFKKMDINFNCKIMVTLGKEKTDTIELISPRPTSYADLWLDDNEKRKFGVGLISLKVKQKDDKVDKDVKGQSVLTVDFKDKTMPEFLESTEGLSIYEPWGRWSDAKVAPTVKINFKKYLPNKFSLYVKADSYEINKGKDLLVKIGTKKYIVKMKKEFEFKIDVNLGKEKNKTIEFIPPNPISPSELWLDDNDKRKLGVGFKLMKIMPQGVQKSLKKSFTGIIDLKNKTLPTFIESIEGLSVSEQWGRWTDSNVSPVANFSFKEYLPDKFYIYIDAVAYGPNVGENLIIIAGSQKYKIKIPSQKFESKVYVDLNGDKTKEIKFVSPKPTKPEGIEFVNKNFVDRKLGIGFFKIIISNYEGYNPDKTDDITDESEKYFQSAMIYDKRLYLRGKSPIYNDKNAFELYIKAANMGNKNAQRSLVGLYRRGWGCDRSYYQAVKWYLISHGWSILHSY